MKKRIWVALGILLLLLMVLYLVLSFYFQSHFVFRTTINHLDVGGQSAGRTQILLKQAAEKYRLTFYTWDGRQEDISGEEIGLRVTLSDETGELLKSQNAFAWPYYLLRGRELEVKGAVSYDRQACEEKLKCLDFMQEKTWIKSEDAYISEYTKDGYQIVPEIYGSEIKWQELKNTVDSAVLQLDSAIDLAAAGCYAEPVVTAENEKLNEIAETLNRYAGVTITYEVWGGNEVLDGETIHTWLSVENQEVKIDEQAAGRYARELAKKYNTAFHSRVLATSYGQSVPIVGGDYGWKVDTAAERDMIIKDIKAGEDVTRELVYAQTANSHDANDYGTTYVEINLTAQHLFFYKEGKLVVESDFVSGNLEEDKETPTGAYSITYKQRDAVLESGDEEKRVSYWMPFDNAAGMCDAAWRREFGGSIYRKNGSDGCVELPVVTAKTIFEQIEAGYPVLIYELPGTECEE